MTRPPQDLLETIAGDGWGLRVRFIRQGQRISHMISVVDPDMEFPLLVSVEGNDQQAFPPSPALQQITIEKQRNRPRTAMLLGMAGRNHWSMSVEVVPDRLGLLFDVACRCTELTDRQQLISTYTILLRQTVSEQQDGTIQIPVCQRSGRLRFETDVPKAPTWKNFDSDSISFGPTESPTTGTQRWCYVIGLTSE